MAKQEKQEDFGYNIYIAKKVSKNSYPFYYNNLYCDSSEIDDLYALKTDEDAIELFNIIKPLLDKDKKIKELTKIIDDYKNASEQIMKARE